MGDFAGHAVSDDGGNGARRDNEIGLEPSNEDWDSNAIAYPYVINVGKRVLLFYNDNGFGKTGSCWAEQKIT